MVLQRPSSGENQRSPPRFAGAHLHQLVRADCGHLSQLWVQWHHIGSSKSAAVGVFTPWKLANSANQGFVQGAGCQTLISPTVPSQPRWSQRKQSWKSANINKLPWRGNLLMAPEVEPLHSLTASWCLWIRVLVTALWEAAVCELGSIHLESWAGLKCQL